MSKNLFGGQRFLVILFLLVSTAALAAPPRAHHIYISGATPGTTAATGIVKTPTGMRVGEKLYAYYTYGDADGTTGGNAELGTTFQWYTFDDFLGTNPQPIAGAVLSSFTLTATQVNKYIGIQITPRNLNDGAGTPAMYKPFNATTRNFVYTTNGNCQLETGSGTPTPGNIQLNPSATLCSPRQLTWQVRYTGINWQTTGGLKPKIIIDWGDGTVETLDPRIKNLITNTFDVGLYNVMATAQDTLNLTYILNQEWRVEQAHTFDYTGAPPSAPSTTANEKCTYSMTATWGVGGSSCIGFSKQVSKFFVWDKESNTSLGTLDVNHVTGTGGFETGEITDICPFDRTAIKLADASDFNCTPGGIVENANPNNAPRWVQFVYGTANSMVTGAGATEKITIGTQDYLSTDLPVYGEVLFQPSGTSPWSQTQGIKVPTTALAGQTLEVTMRIWNVCAQFDVSNGMAPLQVIGFQTFNIYGPPGKVNTDGWASNGGVPLNGGVSPYYANALPVTRTYTIRITTAPPPPTVTYTANHCDTDADNTFTFTTSHTVAGSTLRWYSDAALTNLQKTSTSSNTFNPIMEGTPVMVKAATSQKKVISYYVTEQWPGTNGCLSQPRTVTFNITDTNTAGAIDHPNEIGTTQVIAICSGDDPPAFTSPTAASGGDGATYNYQWQSSTTSGSAGFSDIATATSATYDPGVLTATTWFRRGVSSGYCATVYTTAYEIRADKPVLPGSISGNQIVCETADPANITSSGSPSQGDGTTYQYQWESSTTGSGGPFNTVGGATIITYDPPVLAQSTWYRRRVTSGACATDGPDADTNPDNIAYSNVVSITVHEINDPGVIGNGQIICSGADPTALTNLTSASGGDGVNYAYQWQQSAALAGPFADIGGATAITFDPPVLTSTTYYRRRVRSPGPVTTTCTEAFSNVITITVNPLPTATSSGGGSVCSGTPASDITWTMTGTGPFNFTITASTAQPGFPKVLANYATSTYTITAPNPGSNTTYTMTALSDANTCNAVPGTMGAAVTVTIQATPPPTVDSFTAEAAVCDDGATTNPPDAILDLAPNSVQTYAITYNLVKINGGATVATITNNYTSDAAGVVHLAPTYANFGAAPTDPLGYKPVITAIQNTTTLCAGAVPINGPALIINARPGAPSGAVGATSCSTDPTGAKIKVAVPAVGFSVVWSSTNAPTFTAATGVTGGTRGEEFTPTSNATTTYYAFTLNNTTICRSTAALAVTQTRDTKPADAAAGADQPNLCVTTATLAATAATNGGTGTWTVVTAPGTISFGNSHSATTTVSNLPQSAPGGAAVKTTLRWTVTSALGACTATTDDVDLTVNSLPAVSTVPISLSTVCEDLPGGGSHAGFDLTTLNATVTGGTAGVTVEWFAGPGLTNPIIPATTPQIITNAAGSNDFFFRLSTAIPCTNTGSVVFTVRSLPTKTDQSVEICEDAPPGSLKATGINLQNYETAIAGGSMTNRDVEWYEDITLTTLIIPGASLGAEQNYSINATKDIYAKIIDTASPVTPKCYRTGKLTLKYQARPNNNQIQDGIGTNVGASYTVCASSNLVLLQINPSLNPGSTITWNVPATNGEFNLLTGTTGFYIILQFPNPIPKAGTVFPTGVPISVTETLGTAACAGNTMNTKITVEGSPPKPIITGPSSVCSNANGVAFNVSNPVAGTYSWSLPAGATITSLPVTDPSILVQMSISSGNVSVTHASGTGCTSPASDPYPVSVAPRPSMTSLASNTICSGSNVKDFQTLSANIAGTKFNWEVINVAGAVTGAILGDAQNNVTEINQTLINVSGVTGSVTYRVTPVGPNPDNCQGNPQNLTITINPAPAIIPGQSKVVCSGQQINKEILLSPSNLPAGTLFSWVDPDGAGPATAGSNIPMGTSGTPHITEAITNKTNAPIIINYMITAMSGAGCSSNTAVMVSITINPEPVGVTPASPFAICSSTPQVGFDIENNIVTLGNNLITGNTYNWYAIPHGVVTGGTPQASAGTTKTITDKLVNKSNIDQTVVYKVTPTNGSCAGATFDVNVLVHPEPVGFDDIAATCSDVALNYSFATNINNTVKGGNGLSTGTAYDWQADNNTDITGETTSIQHSTSITDQLTNLTTSDKTVIYRITPYSNGFACKGSTFTYTVTVHPEPHGANSAPSFCSNNGPLNIDLEANILNTAGGGNGLITGNTYHWRAQANANVTGPSFGPSYQSTKTITDNIINVTNTDQVVRYEVYATSAGPNSCDGDTYFVDVTIHPQPVGFSDPTPSICSKQSVAYSLTNNVADTGHGGNNLTTGTTFDWTIPAPNANITGVTSTANSVTAINDILRNITNTTQSVKYHVIPHTAGCYGAAFDITVTVKPEPRGWADNTFDVCSNKPVNYNLVANIATTAKGGNNLTTGTNYSWFADDQPNTTGETLSATPGTTNTITDVVRNFTNINQIVTYHVTPTSVDGCAGDDFILQITIRPEPVGATGDTYVICSSTPMAYSLTGNIANTGMGGNNLVTGTSFEWYTTVDQPNVTGETIFPAKKPATSLNDIVVNTTTTSQVVTYTIVPKSADGCFGDPFTVDVTINPQPVGGNDLTSWVICSASVSGNPANYDLENNIVTLGNNVITGTNYDWTATNNGNVGGEGHGTTKLITDVLTNFTNVDQIVKYTVKVTSSAGCGPSTFEVDITVHPEPKGWNDPSAEICSNTSVAYDLNARNIANVAQGANNLTAGTTFNYVVLTSNPNVSGAVTATNVTSIADVLVNTTASDQAIIYQVTPFSANGCEGQKFTVRVNVKPEPVGTSTTPTYCSNGAVAVNYDLNSNVIAGNGLVIGTTYDWVAVSDNPNVSGETVGTHKFTSNITDKLTNVTNASQVVDYIVRPKSVAGCFGTDFHVKISVSPEPVGLSDTNPVICSKSSVNYDLDNNVMTVGNALAGTNFTWIAVADNANVSGESLTNKTTSTITDVLKNVTSTVQDVQYKVTPKNGSCTGADFFITVHVQPEPIGYTTSKIICSNDFVAYDILNGNVGDTGGGGNGLVTGTTFSWTAVGPGVTGFTASEPGPKTMINDQLKNITSAVQTVTYTVVGLNGTCVGNTFTISVQVRPEPIGLVDTDAVCSGNGISYDIQARNINTLGNSVNSNFSYTVLSSDPASVPVIGKNRLTPGNAPITDTYLNRSGADVTVTYHISPFSISGTCSGTPFDVTFTIHPEPLAPALSFSTDRCSNAPMNYDLQTLINAAGGNNVLSFFKYSVASSDPAAVAPGSNRITATAALIGDTYANKSGSDVLITYHVTPVSQANGCEGKPFDLVVTIFPEPVGGTVNDPVCSTTLNHDMQTQIANGVASKFTYTVTSSNPGAVPAGPDRVAANSDPITDVYANTSGANVTISYKITPISTAHGCSGSFFFYNVTIGSKPQGTDPSLKGPICSNVPFSFDPQADITNGVTSTFTWTVAYDPGLNVKVGKPSHDGAVAETLENKTSNQLNATYTVTPISTGTACQGPTYKIIVSINPEPVVASNLDATQCSDVAYGLDLNTDGVSIGAATYNISALVDPGLTGTPTTGATVAANAIHNDKYTNQTATQLKVTYTVIPTAANTCVGSPKDVVFKVNPEPVLASQALPDVCSDNADHGSTTGIVLGTNGSSINAGSYLLDLVEYKYLGDPSFSGTLPVGFTAAGTNTLAGASTTNANLVKNDKFTNISDKAVVTKYTVTPISPSPQGCAGDPMDFIINVNPQPTLDPALTPTPVCSDVISAVTLRVSPGPPVSVAASEYAINAIAIGSGLVAGPSNSGLGAHKPNSAIFNDLYTNTTSGVGLVTYDIQPMSAAGCYGVTKQVQLTINPAPNLLTPAAFACTSAVSGISLSGDPTAVSPATFDILSITVDPALVPDAGNKTTNTGQASGYLTNDKFQNPTDATHQVRYSVKPVSGAGCKGPAEDIVLTVEPTIKVTPVIAANHLCGDALLATSITLNSPTNPSAGSVSMNFLTAVVPAQITGQTTVANSLPKGFEIKDNIINNSNVVGTVTYNVTPVAAGADDGLGCTGAPVPVVITVEPKPKLGNIPSKTICEGQGVAIHLNSATVPTGGSTALYFDMTSAAGGNPIGYTLSHRYNNPDDVTDVLTNGDPTNSSVTYTFIPKFDVAAVGTCVGDQVQTTVTIAPTPQIAGPSLAKFAICSGTAFDPREMVTDTDPSITSITWEPAVDNPNVSGESKGGGNEFTQVLFNTSGDKQVVTYNITAKNIGTVPVCAAPPQPLIVTVYPNPKMLALPSSQNVCYQGTLNITLNASSIPALPTLFDWTTDNGGNADLPVLGGGVNQTAINQVFDNTGDFLGTQTYAVKAHVTIDPADQPTADGNVCYSDNESIMIVNIAPQLKATFYGFDIDGNQATDLYLCRGSKQFIYFEPEGLPLMTIKYTKSGVAGDFTLNKVGGLTVLQDAPTATTTYTLTSVTDKFACEINPNTTVTVHVDEVDNNFSIVGPNINCSPFPVTFQHNQVNGTSYTWKWLDGPDSTTYIAAADVSGQLIHHTFENPAPNGTIKFKTSLDAFLDETKYLNGCRKRPVVVEVDVYPTVMPQIFTDKPAMCSDDIVTITNSTQGATSHRFSYHVDGSSTELEVQTATTPKQIKFQIPNTTTLNPIKYVIKYEATNGHCPVVIDTTAILVYRGITAHFSHTAPTLYIGGHSTMTLTNDSAPVDGAAFSYDFDFGLDANPPTSTSPGPTFNLDYTTPGPKDLVLVATNMQALTDGLTCSSTYSETINIVVPPLIADFVVVPLTACFPTDITVTENLATGDQMQWRVLDAAGTAAQSNADLPVFKIPAPGIYTVELTTINSFTNDQKTVTKDVTIYDLPTAWFQYRPSPVYVPDTELLTYNLSERATSYAWDFGDGATSDEKEPKHTYKVEGVYDITLIAENDHGGGIVCMDTAVLKVTAKQGGITRVPNAFTPSPNGPSTSNGGNPAANSFNDVFLPQVKGAEEFNMQIFDRWGNLIFESNNSNIGWDGYNKDGKLLPAGVYVYKLTLRLSDGQRTTQVGDVTMIR